MHNDVIIIGAGGHSKVVSDIIVRSGDNVFGILDDNPKLSHCIGTTDDCRKYLDKQFIIAIGNNAVRKKIVEKYPDLNFYTAIDPSAIVSGSAKIGAGTVVMPNAVINADSVIGAHVIVNTSSVVEHDCIVGDFVHISPRCVLCGTVKVGNETWIGAGAVVKNNIDIAPKCMIGCGATVVKNIKESGVFVGIPARQV